MTFDEWFVEYNKTNGLPPAHVVAEAAWNAAIEACKDDLSWEHRCMLLAADRALQALKTPLEGSNGSEVVRG